MHRFVSCAVIKNAEMRSLREVAPLAGRLVLPVDLERDFQR